jgi:hypothetical protein
MGDWQIDEPPPNRNFSYPIYPNRHDNEPPMKNISPLVLPTFRGNFF